MIQTRRLGNKVPSRRLVLPIPDWRWLILVCALTARGVVGDAAAQTPGTEMKHSYVPANGFVPDSVTAARIAAAVLAPIYPAKVLEAERPFKATLSGDTWTVEGTLPHGARDTESIGGVAVVEISKADGRILRVSHGK